MSSWGSTTTVCITDAFFSGTPPPIIKILFFMPVNPVSVVSREIPYDLVDITILLDITASLQKPEKKISQRRAPVPVLFK